MEEAIINFRSFELQEDGKLKLNITHNAVIFSNTIRNIKVKVNFNHAKLLSINSKVNRLN